MTTTTIETEATTRIPAARPVTERAVFVTESHHRSRRLRQAALAIGALASLWLAGLGIGTLGLGRLPGVSLPIPGRGEEQPERAVEQTSDVTRSQARSTPRLSAARASIAPATQPRAAIRSRSSRGNGAVRAKPPGTVPASGAAQGTPLPAAPGNQSAQPMRRGLARRNLTAPPGQTKRETRPQPPTEQPPGQARRRAPQATATTTVPLPPGQQKPDKPPPKG